VNRDAGNGPLEVPVPESDTSFIVGGGETGTLVRAIDWQTTTLGPARAWPQSLRTALDICLSSRFPIALYWGSNFSMLYNDDLLPMVGANKHPWAMGKPAQEVLPEIWSIIGPLLREVVDTGKAIWSEDLMLPLLRSETQEESYFTFTYSPVRDEAGNVGGVMCAVLETTEKIIEERRLRLLNALAEATQAKTPADACVIAAAQIARSPSDVPFALFYLLDEATQVAELVANANIEGGTAWSPTTIGLDDRSVWPLEDAWAGELAKFVLLGNGPAGSRAAVILRIERSGGGSPFGFIVAGLSTLLRSTESYARFHRLLSASLSQSVSNAAAYEQEKQRAEALAELDRAKTAFFANVSHEFRTPLTLMLGPLAELIADGSLPEVATSALEVVQRNGLRLLKLVNNLLDVSRLEAGGVAGTFEPLELGSATRDLASMFQAAIEKAGLELVVDVEEPTVAQVDRDMWEKIVLNLLSNSLKHTFEGKIEVRLRREGGVVVLAVRDTGVGIPEAELPHVFERFHRVAGARSRTHEGSGIGLALVRELVRLHKGEIAVASTVNEGTTFTVRLPPGHAGVIASVGPRALLDWISSPFIEESGSLGPSPVAPPAVAASATVLVVDDNADMRNYVAGLLSPHWNVELARDGAEALRMIRASAPNVILSDIMMPGIDGLQLLREVRSDEALTNIPVILLSARAGQEASVAALAAGASDYLVKPFSSRELVARVATHVALGRARAAERDANERLQALFAEAPVAVSVTRGPEFIFALANPRYEAMVGRTGLVGKPFRAAFPEVSENAPVFEMIEEVRRSGKPFVANEYAVTLDRRADGVLEEVCFMFTCQPIHEPDGTVDTILTIAVDVTEPARMRRELESLALRERAARAQAEAASSLKDEFLSTASHELRTPLNAILGWARLLSGGTLDSSAASRALETIERNARAQVQLIEDILDGSRIITGKLRLEVRPLDMTMLVRASIDAIRPAANAKNIAISLNVDPDAVRISGDFDRLQQVLWNLVNNAIKFTPKRGKVSVSLSRVESSIELAVEDSGQGIAADFLPHIFERFRQADGSTTRRHGGLGLGLALARHLVEAHGGTIRVDSAGVNLGARFTVLLPIQAVLEPDLVSHRLVKTDFEPLPPGVGLSGVTALVIDDELDARELVATVLRASGATVLQAASAEQALQVLAVSHVDILISDIGMPDVDGYELLRRIRAQSGTNAAQVPAVALTAYARELDRNRALEAGFQTHVAKPVEPVELVRVVARSLGETWPKLGS
jgi:signal transduction histidine kinase/DNA-binding response OmpR family regulator